MRKLTAVVSGFCLGLRIWIRLLRVDVTMLGLVGGAPDFCLLVSKATSPRAFNVCNSQVPHTQKKEDAFVYAKVVATEFNQAALPPLLVRGAMDFDLRSVTCLAPLP